MNVFLPIILHVAILNVFERAYCTFCKSCFRLTHCRVSFHSFSAGKVLDLPANSAPDLPFFFWSILFGKQFQKLFPSSLFLLLPLHTRFCQTSRGELVNTLHQYCLLSIYQHMLDPYTKFYLWISQRLSFLWLFVLLVWTQYTKPLNVKLLWPVTERVSLLLPDCAQNHMLQIIACSVSAILVVQILIGIQASLF